MPWEIYIIRAQTDLKRQLTTIDAGRCENIVEYAVIIIIIKIIIIIIILLLLLIIIIIKREKSK